MTKYVIEFVNLSNGAARPITGEFLNKTAAQQVLRQKLARYKAAATIITEETEDSFCYRGGGIEYWLRIREV